MIAQNDIESFLEGFKVHRANVENFKIDSNKKRFEKLLLGWRPLVSKIESYEKVNASEYNIFHVLKNIRNKEVITHSPFLSDLLNIDGDHKQGDLFYKEFIKLLNLPDNKFIPDQKILFSITEPKYIGLIDKEYNEGGSIDILIRYRDSNKHFTIAIENKIGAIDQPKQLQRYYKYLNDVYKENILLVYLSPGGNEPSTGNESDPVQTYSITKKLLEELKDKKEIRIISYKKEIKELLNNTINDIKAESVRSIVNQYLQIIDFL
jgi:hypothetical protein